MTSEAESHFFFTVLQLCKQDLAEVMESQGRVIQPVAQRRDPSQSQRCWWSSSVLYADLADCNRTFHSVTLGQGQPLDHCLQCWSQIWFKFFYLYVQDPDVFLFINILIIAHLSWYRLTFFIWHQKVSVIEFNKYIKLEPSEPQALQIPH